MKMLELLKKIPIDLGQAGLKHNTEGKKIALRSIPPGFNGSHALDVGCRDGYYSELLKHKGYTVQSIDIDPQYPHAKIVDADKRLPWKNSTFDLVWSSEVIEHLKDLDFSIGELRRVLKPGGLLILTTPNSGCWVYKLLTLFGIPPSKAQNSDHKHFFTIEDMRRLFPKGKIMGFFPYTIFKFVIKQGFVLTPTFVIIEKKSLNKKETRSLN